jgi:hypothetical protein
MMRALRQLDDQASPSLQMENELLGHETRHLRARLAQAERRLRRAREQSDRLPEREAKITSLRERLDRERKLRKAAERTIKRKDKQLARAAATEADLRWLLDRLQRSLAGPFLRRRPGFRALLDKHGGKQE